MVSNRRLVTAEGPDFYPTPPWGTRALLAYTQFTGPLLEPCCGDGAMADVLKQAGHHVIASDIINRGYGETRDFLDIRESIDNIVTNPPFNIAETLLAHALTLAQRKVCFLLRTAFLESKRRFDLFYRDRPPATLLIFTQRLSMYPKGYQVKGGGTTSYAWFIWDKEDSSRQTRVQWIAPGMKEGRQPDTWEGMWSKPFHKPEYI